MKLIADQEIPYLYDFFPNFGELVTLPAKNISAETIKDADALLVRSVTSVNKQLLENSSVRFVGSATAGIDHLDTNYLSKAGIAWHHAPGCNARAVADYVLLSVACLMQAGYLQKSSCRAGVIGMGHVGRRVAAALEALGFSVVVNDPLRAEEKNYFQSTPLDQFYDLDVICLHTPLTRAGAHSTYHLINTHFLSRLNAGCILLNAGRGAVIDSHALKKSQHITVLDVWENEPDIDLELAQSAFIATPHIAGYSQAAKFRATQQLFKAFCDYFKTDGNKVLQSDPSEFTSIHLSESDWIERTIQVENLLALSHQFKAALQKDPNNIRTTFHEFRKRYKFRAELSIDTEILL